VGGIGVITNPRSRKNRKNPRLVHQLAYVLGEQGHVAAPNDLDALEDVARYFKKREIEVLAINGGDGTAHVALTAFVKVYGDTPLPKIALLRGGTMNTVATGLGIRGRPDGLLGALVRRYHLGEPFAVVERNLLRVGDHVGFLFGVGLATNFLEIYYKGQEPSPWKAFKLVMRCVFSAIIGGRFIKRITRPLEVCVEVNGKPWITQRFLALVAGTVTHVGLGLRPFLQVVRHPGQVQFMGFACTILRVAMLLPRARRGLPLEHPEVFTELGKRIVMTSEVPMAYTIDGDMYQGDKTLVMEVGPRVELIVG
jgi:diacylglycerol kinase family enzyme